MRRPSVASSRSLALTKTVSFWKYPDQQQLELAQRLDLIGQALDRAADRRVQLAMMRDVAIDVIDDLRVERLLPLEDRADHPPDEAGETAFPAAFVQAGDRDPASSACLVGPEDRPLLVDRRDAILVEARRRMRHRHHFLDPRSIDQLEGFVVGAIGLFARGAEATRSSGVTRPLETHRPMTPSIGLLAVA